MNEEFLHFDMAFVYFLEVQRQVARLYPPLNPKHQARTGTSAHPRAYLPHHYLFQSICHSKNIHLRSTKHFCVGAYGSGHEI
jgi:hypothetical protein